jgi:hypothetical protein
MSAQVPTYGYEFIYQSAPYYFPKMPGFQPLAKPRTARLSGAAPLRKRGP